MNVQKEKQNKDHGKGNKEETKELANRFTDR